MAWYLMHYHQPKRGPRRFEFCAIDGVPQVFSQEARRIAQELSRRAWIKSENNAGRGSFLGPEVVWREPLEGIEDSQSHRVGGAARDVHQPDETAEYEEYRIGG